MAERDRSSQQDVAAPRQGNGAHTERDSGLNSLSAAGQVANRLVLGVMTKLKEATRIPLSPSATSASSTPQQHSDATSSPQQGAAPAAQVQKSFAEQLTQELKQKYGLDLEYVRHHTPVDNKTREGHFLKAGEREFFWDPEKGTLLAWNAGTKQWEIKKDEGAGARFLASKAAQDLVAKIVKEKVDQLANQSKTGQTAAIDTGAVLNAAATLKQDLQNYGATMVMLDRVARARLSRNEAIIDAIAKICQKQPEQRTEQEASFLRTTGVEPEKFLKLYTMMREARDSDSIVQKQNSALSGTTQLVSLSRLHMVDGIFNNSFNQRESKIVRRIERAENFQALGGHFRNKGLAI
jgi:hypothetical protein